MRDQFAGDVSDIVKFALLRALAGSDRTLGVAWYYVPYHNGKLDGKHVDWRAEPAWQRLDPVLYAGLTGLPDRSVDALERAAIWPQGTVFHREPMPSWRQRDLWGTATRTALESADLVFLDPDKGVQFKFSEEHATFDEIKQLRKKGRTLAFIKFPGRIAIHEVQAHLLHENLQNEAGAERCITLRTSVPSVRWFTVVDPDAELVVRTYEFAKALRLVPGVKVTIDDSQYS